MVECLRELALGGVGTILVKLGNPTLQMIGTDMECYPEHRHNFFLLLQKIVVHALPGRDNTDR
jgi:hypothetical protein